MEEVEVVNPMEVYGSEPRIQLDKLLGEQRQLRASVPIYRGGQTGVHL